MHDFLILAHLGLILMLQTLHNSVLTDLVHFLTQTG